MNRNTWIAVAVSIVVVGFLIFGDSAVSMFNSAQNTSTSLPQTLETTMDTNTNQDVQGGEMAPQAPAATAPVSTLQIKDTVVGTGAEAKAGALITVHYVGTLTNGQKFDSSVDRGQPFQFKLGEGRVIQGWEQGFAGMKVGGKRTLIIPASMGYGANQAGSIPPNSTLVFEVELLKVE
jgi:FKBP-type peptidyl-prolyl cis-trans isomerase